MKPAKGPGKSPARGKAGEKRRIVLPGKPVFTIVAGLALLASLAVLAFVLFGPFPPLPSDHGGIRQAKGAALHRTATAAKSHKQHPKAHTPAKPAKVVAPALARAEDSQPVRVAEPVIPRGELPFEEHLAPHDGTPPGGSGSASEVRARVEPPVPSLPATPSPVESGSATQPVPADAGKGPRMVVVIDDIGDHPTLAKSLVDLPFPVTMAILPNRPRTKSIAAMAAEHGTEIILHQPMQPTSYPRVNPGPGAVFTDMDAHRIRTIVTENLSQVPHAVGVNNHMGSAFTSYAAGMDAVMPVLRAKGLFFMDSVTSATTVGAEAARKAGVHYYRRAVFLDNVRNTRVILGQLKTAERHAIKHGRAIVIGHPYGETLEALKIWAKERDSRIAIVTLTDLGPEF